MGWGQVFRAGAAGRVERRGGSAAWRRKSFCWGEDLSPARDRGTHLSPAGRGRPKVGRGGETLPAITLPLSRSPAVASSRPLPAGERQAAEPAAPTLSPRGRGCLRQQAGEGERHIGPPHPPLRGTFSHEGRRIAARRAVPRCRVTRDAPSPSPGGGGSIERSEIGVGWQCARGSPHPVDLSVADPPPPGEGEQVHSQLC